MGKSPGGKSRFRNNQLKNSAGRIEIKHRGVRKQVLSTNFLCGWCGGIGCAWVVHGLDMGRGLMFFI